MISNNKQENFFKLSQNFMFPNTHLTEIEKEDISHIPILQTHNFLIPGHHKNRKTRIFNTHLIDGGS